MQKSKYLPLFLLLIVSLAWGASFSVRFEALQTYSDVQVALFQIFGGFLFFIPFLPKALKKLTKKNAPMLFLSGFLGNVLTSVFYALAQSRTDVSVTSILSALVPIVVFAEGVILYKQAFSGKTLGAILLGLLGVTILIFGVDFSLNALSNNSILGMFFVLLAVLSGATNITLIGFAIPKLTGIEIASLAFLFFAPLAFCGLFFTDFQHVFDNPHFTSSSLMLLLLAFITFIGTLGFNELIKRSTPLFASLSTYLILLIGVLLGVFLTDNPFEWKHFWSIICIFIGVYWINSPKNDKKEHYENE